VQLIFKSGPRDGTAVAVDGARLTIGRVAENDLQLADEKVSRHHAVIEGAGGGRLVLRDLDSRNGTFVDGLRLSGAYTLRGGERLRFGDQQLLVAGGDDRADQPAAAPAHQVDAPPAPAQAAPTTQAGRRERSTWRTPRVIALLVLSALAALVFGVGQLVLPGVAEQRLRTQLARNGSVRRVHIEATPAIELLWHHADSVAVAMGAYRSAGGPSGHGSLADFLSRTRNTGRLDVSVETLRSHLVTLYDVHLRKQGNLLLGEAQLTQANLSAALPSYLNLQPLSASAQGIVLQASATVLGQRLSIHLGVLAKDGRVVVRPEGVPLGSLATITVFSDPRIYVESLGAELHGQRYLLTARARLQ
jgi:hypothetical protein